MRAGRGLCLQPWGHCLAYGQKPWTRDQGAWSMAPGRRRAAVGRANGKWPAGRKYERRSSITALRSGRTANGRMAASRPLQACSMRTGQLWVATGRGEDGCHSTRACWRAIMADVHCLFLCTVCCVSCSGACQGHVRGCSGAGAWAVDSGFCVVRASCAGFAPIFRSQRKLLAAKAALDLSIMRTPPR